MIAKNRHRRIFLQRILSFLFVVFLVYSCVQDDFSNYRDVSVQEINDYKFDKISFSDLKNNTKALQKVREINNLKNKASGRAYRKVYDEQFGVFIDTTQIVMLSNEHQHTITFRIVSKGDNDNEVENLVLQSKESGEYSAYITKYELSGTVSNELLNASLVSITSIDNNYQTNMLGNVVDCIDTRTITSSFCRDRDGNVFGYDDKGEVDTRCHGMPYTETHLTIYIDLKCMGGGAGGGAYTGGGGYGSGGYDYGSGFDFGGNYGGGGSSGNTGGGNTSNPNQPGNGNTNPENPKDGSLNDYGLDFPTFPTTPIVPIPDPEPEPIDHIAELEKITDKDATTPFRAKIDEYVGLLDVTQVEAGVIYERNESGGYDVVLPSVTSFNSVNFSDFSTRAEVRIHLHHNQSNSKGEMIFHAPSTADVIAFCQVFSFMYTNNVYNRERWTDIVVTANGLYALRAIDPQKIVSFDNDLSSFPNSEKIIKKVNKIYNSEIVNRVKNRLKNNCSNGCTSQQIKQIRNSASDDGIVKFINKLNKKYNAGVGLFKGTLNTNTGNYDWQKVSE